MCDQDWFDDYMDYKLSGYEDDEKPSETSGCLPWVLGVLTVLWILSSLFS